MSYERKHSFDHPSSTCDCAVTSGDFQVLNEDLSSTGLNTHFTTLNIMESGSTCSLEHEIVSKIIDLLELEQTNESRIQARKLLINGRQTLSQFTEDISPVVFHRQMSQDNSELLNLLKVYTHQLWETTTEEWFRVFLIKQKSESPDLYDQILTRTAEYGSKYLKDNPSLSLVLQFIFEFDDFSSKNEQLFEQIWVSLVINGRQALSQYSEYIASVTITEQLSDNASPLFLALKTSFREPLSNLLKKINKLNMLDMFLNDFAEFGWLNGLNQPTARNQLAPNKLKILANELEEYLKIEAPIGSIKMETANNSTLIISSSSTTLEQTLPKPPLMMVNSSSDENSNKLKQEESQKRTREVTLVFTCTERNQQWRLSHLVQAGELMYINKTFDDVISKIVENYRKENDFTKLTEESFQSIMYLLKRHQNLNNFIETLFFKYSRISSNFSLPKLNLRMFIDILLLKSDFSLSRMIMSLLSKRNPVPFIQPSLTDSQSYRFVPSIIHVWNYDLPTILSFGIGKCLGKSTLLNTIFMSSFEQSTSSIYFQQTIDIDFGYSFLTSRLINIADTHGSMTEDLFNRIYDLFDGFLIHIEYEYLKNNLGNLQRFFTSILQMKKYYLILIRDIPDDLLDQPLNWFETQTFQLPNIADQNKTQNKYRIGELSTHILKNIPNKSFYEKKCIQSRLKYLFETKDKEQLDEINGKIRLLKEILIQILQNDQDIKKYFPQYMKYVEYCVLKLQLANYNFYGDGNDITVSHLQKKLFDLKIQLQNHEENSGIIFELFIDILKSSNMLLCLELLGTELKHERSRLISKGDLAKQLPIHKSLSLEILWRNVIVCINQQTKDMQEFLYRKYSEYILAGYPFEILDGDNFYFPYEFLTQSLNIFREKKILVISIIGPQNSGKSTLLNYMFGTLFDVRDGRCTRGIYGSFVKSNRPNYDYVLLIDTEGLLGVERTDLEYDRRIVLFCLAVSHLVIVNMLGEVNTPLQTMLTLCTDSLRQMGVTRIPQPHVHFILNQKADLNMENNRAAIEKIISDLRNNGPTIDIKNESFHTLPSAFKKESNSTLNASLPSLIKTEPDFLERVQLLCGQLMSSAETVFCRSTEFSDPIQWIKSSFTIFETLEKFSDLTYYHDINERRQDNEIREYIRVKLTEIFSSTYRNQLIDESFNKNEIELNQMFITKQFQIQEPAHQDLENTLKLLKASDTIRKRSRQFLDVQIVAAFNALETTCAAVNEREKIKLLVQNGEGDLRQLIHETINSGIVMSSSDAIEKFERMFADSVKDIQSKFVPSELLKNALNYIYAIYNIYEKEGLPDFQEILSRLRVLNRFIDTQSPINDLQNEFILNFSQIARRQEPVEVHPFTNDQTNAYTFEQIGNLIYLNKEKLEDYFIEYLERTHPNVFKRKNSQHNRSKDKIIQFLKAIFSRELNENQPTNKINTANFFRDIRYYIREQKRSITQEKIDDSNVFLPLSVCTRDIIEKIFKEMTNSQNNQIRQVQTELIQKIVGLVHTIILNIDNELRPFCLSLSRQLKADFHICAIGLLTMFYFIERRNHFQQTLNELNEKKNDLKDYFVQMVVPDATADPHSARNLIKQFQDLIIKLLNSQGQRIINTQLEQHDNFNRKYIQNICDGQLLVNNNQTWLIDYIENPTKIIEEQFNEMWKDILRGINQKLTENKTDYQSILNNFFFCLGGIKNAIESMQCSANTFVQDIFQPQDNNSLNVKDNYVLKKRCMAFLLYQYLSKGEIQPTIIIRSTQSSNQNYQLYTFKLRSDVFDLFQKLSKQRSPSTKLQNAIQQLSTVFDRTSIDNPMGFLQNLLNEKNNVLNEYDKIDCDFDSMDKEDTYSRLLDKIRGCPNLCPCCKRPCDVDHTQIRSRPGSKDNEHRCTTGHALRAMNGYKFELTGEASLMMCEQIKDNQILIIDSQRMKWSEFKQNHNDWDFQSAIDQQQLTTLHGKFLTLWTKIGPMLCDKYNMKYVSFNTIKPDSVVHESFHWILVLDGSGSMHGEPWRDLLQAVEKFLAHRIELNTTDRITIIIFSDSANYACFNEDVHSVKIDCIRYPYGNTNFTCAFTRVNECIERFKTDANMSSTLDPKTSSNHAIIFMTDGESTYPEIPLNKLVSEHGTNIRFWTLALGNKLNIQAKNVLEQINRKMNGSYYTLTASSELHRTFAEIASNTKSTCVHSNRS